MKKSTLLYEKFILLLTLLLLIGGFSVDVWGATSSVNTPALWKSCIYDAGDSVVWSAPHVTFKLHGGGNIESYLNDHVLIQKDRTYTLDWRVDDDYEIHVTQVSVHARSTLDDSYITVGTNKSSNVGPAVGIGTYTTVNSQSLSLGNTGSVSIRPESGNGEAIFHMDGLTVTYTIDGEEKTVTFDGTKDWGNNGTEKYKPDSFKIDAPHVTFSLQREMKQYNSGSGKKKHEYFYLTSDEEKAPLKWWVAPGYTINVNSIEFDSKNQKSWGTTGKGYVSTSRGKEVRVRQDENRGTNTFAVSDGGADNLFGNPATPLTNNEYFSYLKATSREWNIYGITLTYTINPNSYNITLDSEGGSGGSTSVTVTYDSNTQLSITNPEKDGYTFEGWWTNTGGTGTLVIDVDGYLQANVTGYTGEDGVWKKDATTTLYAKWVENSKTITLHNQSATTSGTESLTVYYNRNTNLTATPAITIPEKTGYTFEGYYTETSGYGVQFIDRNGNVNANVAGYTDGEKNWISEDGVTLYAYWKQNQVMTWGQTLSTSVRSTVIELSASAPGGTVTYTATSNAGTVRIEGNTLTCLTAGSVTVTAHQSGNHDWNAAEDVSKTFIIIEHRLTTNPTASGIIYKQTLASSTLSGGVATVSGTWSWDDNSVAPGVGTASHVAVFTPNNASGAFTASDTLHCLVDVTVSRMPTTIEYIGADSYAVNAANIPATSLFQVRGSNGELLASPAITLETSDDSKIAIVGGNAVDFLCGGGSATITASYAGDANYLASNLGRSITVNQLSDAIVWNNVRAEDNKIHVWADTVLTATMASANTGITYTIEGGTNVSVEGSTYTITTPGEVTLRATSAGSCTYASVTDTKQVVVDHCRHFLVWDQDFAALPPDDEEGHIDFSEALTAYAVDSTGVATGVTVNYSMPSVDFAHIEDGVLYVTGTGSTTITATTVSDDKFAVVSKTIAVNVLAPGDLGATVGKSTLIDNFNDEAKSVSWTSGHVTFTLSGNGLYTDKWVGSKYFYLYARSSTYTYELTWTVNDKDVNGNSAYIINVKKLSLDVDRASGLGTYVTIAGNRSGNIYDSGNIPAGGLSSGDLNLGEDGKITITVETSDAFWSNIAVNNINVLYTLLPVINTENQSVDVTVCDDNKQLLDLSECASLADRSAHAALSYRVISDNASDAHITADKKFYANSVGSYTVRAAVPQTVCHNPNTAEFTITVTPAALSLSPTASDITYRQALSASTLTGTATVGGCAVAGTWAWSAPATVPYVGEDQPFAVVFTPSSDADNYSGFTTTALVDVKRAQFIFDGSGDDEENKENWAIVDNWQSNADPGEEDVAIIRHDVIIAAEVAVYSLKIEGESKVTVAPTGGLTVGAGGIIDATKDNFKLQAGTSGVEKGQTGYLRISPDYAGAMPEATVELFSVSYYDQAAGADNSAVWQGVGSPISEAGVLAKSVYTSCWVYSWNEATDGWVNNRATLKLTPFVGFSTTQKKEPEGRKYTYEGHLVSGAAPVTMDLAYTAGHGTNLLANSWAAPISIPNFESSDFVKAAQTIYILNAGTKAQSDANVGDFTAPGKYIGVPIQTASELAASGYPVVIPSMQGFWVQAEGASAQLQLDYSRLVWGADYSGDGSNQPLRAPKHNAEASPVTGKMKVSISAGGWSDFIFLLESEKYLPEYEDGYDAIKIPSGGMDLFTVEGENYLGVDATSSIIGTRVGVRTSEETAYTMTFSHLKSESDMSLWDLEADQKIEINEGTTYTFFAEPNAEITERFLIIERAGAPTNTTGVDDAEDEANVHKFIKDNQLYILKNGVLYNGTGARVK